MVKQGNCSVRRADARAPHSWHHWRGFAQDSLDEYWAVGTLGLDIGAGIVRAAPSDAGICKHCGSRLTFGAYA